MEVVNPLIPARGGTWREVPLVPIRAMTLRSPVRPWRSNAQISGSGSGTPGWRLDARGHLHLLWKAGERSGPKSPGSDQDLDLDQNPGEQSDWQPLYCDCYSSSISCFVSLLKFLTFPTHSYHSSPLFSLMQISPQPRGSAAPRAVNNLSSAAGRRNIPDVLPGCGEPNAPLVCCSVADVKEGCWWSATATAATTATI